MKRHFTGGRGLAFAAFLTVCIVWGTTYLGIRVAVESIPPMLMTGSRYTIAGILLVTILRMRGHRVPRDPRTLINIAIVAVLLIGVGNLAVVWAEQWVPSGVAALFVATAPFWAAIISALRPDGERIRFRHFAGMVIGFGGVALLVTPGGAHAAFDSHLIMGALAIQIGAFAFQAGSIYGKHVLKNFSPLMSAALQALIGGVILDIAGLASGEASRFHPTTKSMLALVYLMVFGTIIGYTAYTYALSKIRATTMALYAYVNPIVAVILGWMVLHESLTGTSIAAMLIILCGMAIVQVKRPRPVAIVEETLEEKAA